jgi:predicted Zn-dependent protease
MQADEAERRLKASNFLITDPALNAYVRGVLCREVAERACGEARIYLTRTPYFNASMMPNGVMQIWSGLLLRVRDEAQLAAVLGHEFVHYRERHGLKQFAKSRARRTRSPFCRSCHSVAWSERGSGSRNWE